MAVTNITSPDGGSESVESVVAALNDFIHVIEGEDGHHRAKDLILGNVHVIADLIEDCRLDKVPLVSESVTAGQAPKYRPGPLLKIAITVKLSYS